VRELMSVLRLASGDHLERLYTIPPKIRFGANMFYNKSCIDCHTIDGQGGTKGPNLTLRPLKTEEWHIEHIKDPRSKNPKSEMPPFFHYEPYEYEALAEYILYLHTP
jgi:mono/diheme cytochrome c family protein